MPIATSLLLAVLAATEPRVHFDAIVVDGHVDVPMNILALGIDPADPGDREGCFRAFLHNHWVGMAVFAGIAVDYALR